MTKNAIWHLYRRCTDAVLTCVLLMIIASGAQAGAWEEFETRCLAPMENFERPLTGGLDATLVTDLDDGGREIVWASPLVQDIRTVYADGQVQSCSMRVTGDGTALTNVSYDFFAQAQADGRYEVDERGEDFAKFLSTTWREPKLSLTWQVSGDGATSITAQETDLES